MPKAASTLTWSATSETYVWSGEPGGEALSLVPGSPAWFAWLAELPSFAFHGQAGSYTARQERRERGERYWYAYLRTGQKLRKKYLGKTDDLTIARLEQVAQMLHAEETSAVSPGTALPAPQEHHTPRRQEGGITAVQQTTDVPAPVVQGPMGGSAARPSQPFHPLLSTKLHAPDSLPDWCSAPVSSRASRRAFRRRSSCSRPPLASAKPRCWRSFSPPSRPGRVPGRGGLLPPAAGGAALPAAHLDLAASLGSLVCGRERGGPGLLQLHEAAERYMSETDSCFQPGCIDFDGRWYTQENRGIVRKSMAQQPSVDDAEEVVVSGVAALAGILLTGLLYLVLPTNVIIGPNWLLLVIEGVFVIPLLIDILTAWDLSHTARRMLVLVPLSLSTLALVVGVVLFVSTLATNTNANNLLRGGALLWSFNILVFALWYWEIDGEGPWKRHLSGQQPGDFLFPQQVNDFPQPANGKRWVPHFLDYLFVAFTGATALSPADTYPLTRAAKTLMMMEALISITVAALLIARAVNILGK